MSIETIRELEKMRGGRLTFGETVSSLRTCDEVSQVELAKAVGVSRQYICDVEHDRKSVSPLRAAKIAKALGYPPSMFVQIALQDIFKRAGLHLTIKIEEEKAAKA